MKYNLDKLKNIEYCIDIKKDLVYDKETGKIMMEIKVEKVQMIDKETGEVIMEAEEGWAEEEFNVWLRYD